MKLFITLLTLCSHLLAELLILTELLVLLLTKLLILVELLVLVKVIITKLLVLLLAKLLVLAELLIFSDGDLSSRELHVGGDLSVESNIVVGHLVINNHTGHLLSNSHLSRHLVGDIDLRNADINVHADIATESNIDTANFLRMPVLGDNDGGKVEFRVVDFNGSRDSGSSNTTSAHGARDFKEVFRSDQLTSGSRVQDFRAFSKIDQMLSHIPGLGLRVVTTLESGEIDSNEVAVTSTSSLDTLEISLDLGEDSIIFSTTSTQVKFLLKSEGNSGVIRLTLGVIKFHDNLSDFTRSIEILFELSSKDIRSLTAAAATGKVSGDFSSVTLLSVLNGLSDNERLLALESGFILERRFQDGFKSIADIGHVSVTFLMERAGKASREHE